ncbi:MAG: Mur ligase family protein [Bacteroidota bacterium]|nr:Mur ligase family protein [Bacteroidota bacterium]
MHYHFIAIGGSAMHNLAIALHLKGDSITGSDDEIFEPSKSRLAKYNLLPSEVGWDIIRIHSNIDAVILGMHARKDNPELIKAQKLGLSIYSYPEFIYEQTKDQLRIVVGGSHGKTSITSMILHVLSKNNINHNYMVGAQLEGFDCMVKLSKEAKIAVLEGDEYLSSPIDRRPKFHLYQPEIAVVSGIAWDHINVFPTFENYVEQFRIFIDKVGRSGRVIYFEDDNVLKEVVLNSSSKAIKIPYCTFPNQIKNGITYVRTEKEEIPLEIFGDHNLQNLNAAYHVCIQLGMKSVDFFSAIRSFKGASKRLELVQKNQSTAIYKDFAHSPSKLKATTSALKNQYPNRKLIACMELHTFSSLNKSFLDQYNGTMQEADLAFVYFNKKTLKHKKLDDLSAEDVKKAFAGENVTVLNSSKEMVNCLLKMKWEQQNLLLMSSGNFDGIQFTELAEKIITLPF